MSILQIDPWKLKKCKKKLKKSKKTMCIFHKMYYTYFEGLF